VANCLDIGPSPALSWPVIDGPGVEAEYYEEREYVVGRRLLHGVNVTRRSRGPSRSEGSEAPALTVAKVLPPAASV
jgi:hypothetical protein